MEKEDPHSKTSKTMEVVRRINQAQGNYCEIVCLEHGKVTGEAENAAETFARKVHISDKVYKGAFDRTGKAAANRIISIYMTKLPDKTSKIEDTANHKMLIQASMEDSMEEQRINLKILEGNEITQFQAEVKEAILRDGLGMHLLLAPKGRVKISTGGVRERIQETRTNKGKKQ